MSGRPKKKVGRVVNFYLSDEVLDLIEQHRGELSRSQFIEEAVKYYTSHLGDKSREKEKDFNSPGHSHPGRGYRARSKVRDLGSRPVGVRGFESLPLHFEIEIHKFDII